MIETINEFRQRNGKSRIENWNRVVSDYCQEHCWAMVSRGDIYHAETCYLQDWLEAIAVCGACMDWKDTERKLIFDILGTSDKHKEILLNSNEMAYGVIMFKGMVYLTVRSR